MNINILTEKDELTIKYFQWVDENINKNLTLNRFMFYDYNYLTIKGNYKHEVNFRTVFPNSLFIYIIIYSLIIAGFLVILFNSWLVMYITILISIILTIPLIIQSKYIMYKIIKKGMKKQGYGGKTKCL